MEHLTMEDLLLENKKLRSALNTKASSSEVDAKFLELESNLSSFNFHLETDVQTTHLNLDSYFESSNFYLNKDLRFVYAGSQVESYVILPTTVGNTKIKNGIIVTVVCKSSAASGSIKTIISYNSYYTTEVIQYRSFSLMASINGTNVNWIPLKELNV